MSRIITKTNSLAISWLSVGTLLQGSSELNKTASSDSNSCREETGWDRVKRVFETDKTTGSWSKELLLIYSYACGGMVTGAIFGGYVNTRTAAQDFIERNTASRFLSQLDARRRMRDYVMIKLVGGVRQWCPKFTAFASIYGASTVILNAYRGDTTITNYILGGMLTGGLCKINLGMPGVLAGAVVGGFLSGILNSMILLTMKVSGITMEELLLFHKERYYKNSLNEGIDNEAPMEREEVVNSHLDGISTQD